MALPCDPPYSGHFKEKTMPYRIRKEESVEEAVRRIAAEQIGRSIVELRDTDLDRHVAVHQVRKRCKKIRGLIRLVRPEFRAYKQENAYFRDAARQLSSIRDAQSIIETLDKLISNFADQVDAAAFASIRSQLTERRRRMADDEAGLNRRLEDFRGRMDAARRRVEGWSLQSDGFDAVAGGLGKTYARGRKAMKRAYKDPTAENFHEWRKRVKYHWYHARLLESVWRPLMSEYCQLVSELSDDLGDTHDLAVLRRTLAAEPAAFGEARDVQALLGLVDLRRAELRGRARPLAMRVFAEKAQLLVRRIGRYWDAWRHDPGGQLLPREQVPLTAPKRQ